LTCLRLKISEVRGALAIRMFVVAALFASGASAQSGYLGFDRNSYPGDENLPALRKTFSYTGFWLNHPPGEHTNNWIGKRPRLQSVGFGFLVLFNGRADAALKTPARAVALGKSDALAAVAAARREGFPTQTIVFLDQEQGGRMLPEQKAYIYAWVDGVRSAGFRAGIYCSGIPAQDEGGIVTAEDIRQTARGREITYWVTNDACPPSPGCVFPRNAPAPAQSGVRYADIWQFAQSPKRNDVAGGCSKSYSPDGQCYPPEVDPATKLQIDVETASSADPSHGRIH
jgi:hypothetical protein